MLCSPDLAGTSEPEAALLLGYRIKKHTKLGESIVILSIYLTWALGVWFLLKIATKDPTCEV